MLHVGEVHCPYQSHYVDVSHPQVCRYKEEVECLYTNYTKMSFDNETAVKNSLKNTREFPYNI